MAESFTQQFRPHTIAETDTNDALSVGLVRDMSLNENNTCRHAGAHKKWSEVAVPIGKFLSPDAVTAETVVPGMVFAPREIPLCFTSLRLLLGAMRTAGAGNIVWTVYCHGGLYTGPAAFDSTYLSYPYYSATVTTSADANAITPQTLTIERDSDSLVWLVVTATNSAGSVRGQITSFDAWGAP